jgi:Family of unknown function (DUF6922)
MKKGSQLLSLLNPVYFWDADLNKLNEQTDADYIIRRVFELGDIEEIGLVHGWYGREVCRKALLSAEYLREAAIIQGMVFLDIPERRLFKSASKKQHHAV